MEKCAPCPIAPRAAGCSCFVPSTKEDFAIATKVQGNTQGLKPSQLKALGRLYHRRFPLNELYTNEQAREIAELSFSVGRQLGLLIDRQGRPKMVIVGDPGSIFIPELERSRQASGRLRGLRLLHTHLKPDALSQEDLMDLLFLRLDSLAALTVSDQGDPGRLYFAHLLPANSAKEPYHTQDFPWDRATLDLQEMVQALEDEFAREGGAIGESAEESALLVSVSTLPRAAIESGLDELADLAETAGLQVAGRMVQRVARLNPKFIMGKGKLAELEIQALQAGAGLVIFDRELSPAQMRNLADLTERKVLDRTQLILDIFARRATSSAGKLQVEMAQMQYTLPRLVGKNKALSRLMGGIGGRGPGETKLELDRRKIRERIGRIKNELKRLRRQRSSVRQRRAKAGLPVVALVGYTNAGKSTLLNTLTHSEVLAEDKLFATLDPTTRRLRFPEEREVILSDTVGFIRELPAELREAFQATLEELEEADLLLHVSDASHPELEQQIEAVEQILQEMGLADKPLVRVLNKWDKLDEENRLLLRNAYPDALKISAATGDGLDALPPMIISRIDWKSGLINAPLTMIPCQDGEVMGDADDWADQEENW